MSRNAHAALGSGEARNDSFLPYALGSGSMRNFGDSVGIVTPTTIGENGEERFEAHLLDSSTAGERPMTLSDASERAYDDADRDDYGGNRGANRSNREQRHSLTLNEGNTIKQRGFRTQKRAETAVSAYKNRLDDGRNIDTGKYEED